MVELQRLLQLRPGLTEKDPPGQRGKGHETPVPFLQQTPLMPTPQWGLKEGSFAPHLPHLPESWTWPEGLLLLRVFQARDTTLLVSGNTQKKDCFPKNSRALTSENVLPTWAMIWKYYNEVRLDGGHAEDNYATRTTP